MSSSKHGQKVHKQLHNMIQAINQSSNKRRVTINIGL